MSLDLDAKKTLLRKIPHGLFICGVAEGDEVKVKVLEVDRQGRVRLSMKEVDAE